MSLNPHPATETLKPVPFSFPETPPDGIALFDLDGTLIAWDCQLLFRHFILRHEPWRGLFLPVFLVALPLAGILGAGGMKRVFLTYLWKMDAAVLARYAREFATAVVPQIYPELRERLHTHRSSGHLLILSSASPQLYVAEIARELGFDLALGTEVAFTSFFPELENHKGLAKVTRLRSLLPPAYFEDGRLRNCHGYTDSAADLPMLALCSSATLVNPSTALASLGAEMGWETLRPQRPWQSSASHAIRSLRLLLGLGQNSG